MSEHILFLTGKLAQRRLQQVLASMQPLPFSFDVQELGISVAALMTASMIGRRLQDPANADRVLVPGLCRGDLSALSEQLGVPVERGPFDLKDLPEFFGQSGHAPDLSRHGVRLFAEIVDAPNMSVAEIVQQARQLSASGADIIDIGCLPDTPFPHLEEAIRALNDSGLRTSIDSVDSEELLRGGKAGADYLLSLAADTLWIADQVDSTPVLVPSRHGELDSLYASIDQMRGRQKPFYADSILDPVHFGFTESLLRYCQLRERYPDIDIMMGVGNLTELTEADTAGINALLFGVISELNISAVLTTEVSPHARTAVRESDLARRIMFAAKAMGSLPKGLHGGLTGLHERKPFPYDDDEIRELAGEIRDPSYRVMVSETGIHVYNRDGLQTAQDPFTLFPGLHGIQDDPAHAFYLGVELARAQIAWQLGKRYVQDRPLDWGVFVGPERLAAAGSEAEASVGDSAPYPDPGVTMQARSAKKRAD